jgi:outer membrane immunogenic protein
MAVSVEMRDKKMYIKKFLGGLSGAALAAAIGIGIPQAYAADPPRPVMMAPSWTGFYIGGYIGAGAIVNELDILGGVVNYDGVGGEGAVYGGLIGFNYQVGPQMVIGLQGEIGGTDMEHELAGPFGGLTVDAEPKTTASVSARAGWLTTPDTLLYLIAGWSYAKYDVDIGLFGGSANFKEKYNGWHAGAGIETRLTHNLTARVEYRFTQYGDEDWDTGGFIEVEPSSHVGTFALAWNFGGLGSMITPAADPPAPAAVPASWTGPYIGGYVGAGGVVNELNGFLGGEIDGVGGEGGVYGGLIGFNYQLASQFVVGLQGEIGGTDMETETSVLGGLFNLDAKPKTTASVSARLGYLATQDTLLYAIGGWSYAKYEVDISFLGGLATASFKEKYNGWHAGAGVETRLTDSLTGRIEYRYTQYNDEDWDTGGIIEIEPSTHVGTFALVWNFNNLM